jgi:hypothetical protein
MKRYTLLLFSFFFFINASIGQPSKDCFEIKYLDFFGIEPTDTVMFKQSLLDSLLVMKESKSKLALDLEKFLSESEKRKVRLMATYSYIPSIISQLRQFYPTCTTNYDFSTFRKLKQLYFKFTQSDIEIIKDKGVAEQLGYIRQNFYDKVDNDSLLPYMSFTMDDGPLYGQLSKYIPNYKKGTSYQTDFGALYITHYSTKVFVTVINKEGKHLWTRSMTGNSNRPLSEIRLSKEDIKTTSLGYTIRMYADAEALNLYLRNDGRFRFYFHSW